MTWFVPVAETLGANYLRYSFTKGTDQEVGFLIDELRLRPGQRVLDVGCGPGRHALALARHGLRVVGVDISPTFVDLARAAASEQGVSVQFEVGDARGLSGPAEFDLVMSICQGGFGLVGRAEDGAADAAVFERMSRLVRPGGHLVVTGFSSAFAVRDLGGHERFDLSTGVLTESTSIRGTDGADHETELHTTCFTPRELRMMAESAGLTVRAIFGVAPGRYGRDAPTVDHPELLLIGTRAPN